MPQSHSTGGPHEFKTSIYTLCQCWHAVSNKHWFLLTVTVYIVTVLGGSLIPSDETPERSR